MNPVIAQLLNSTMDLDDVLRLVMDQVIKMVKLIAVFSFR